MLSLLLEGFESAWLPCSLILAVPGAAAVLASRHFAIPATIGFFVSAIGLSWLRFADRGGSWPVAVAAIAIAIAVVLFLIPTAIPEGVAAAIGGVLIGGAGAELWEPCVGAEFGSLLNTLPDQGVGGGVKLMLYMVGVLAPVGGFIAAIKLLPPSLMERFGGVLSLVGGTILAIIAVATAIGLHDDVVARLFQWSLG